MKCTFTLLVYLCCAIAIHAEGTKELLDNNCSNKGYLQIWDNNDINRPFATYNCSPEHRLNIRVSAGETIYIGYQIMGGNDVYFRLRQPNGTTAMGATTPATNGQKLGFISSCSEAISGPKQLVGNSGYNAFTHTATMTGDYYIEFAVNNNPTQRNKRIFEFFDVTVADNSGNVQLGRLWSKAWDLTTNGGNNTFNATYYVYSTDSVVSQIDFNGIKPFGFVISCNSFGSSDVGNLTERRKSDYRANILGQSGSPGVPEYPLFLNDPDINHFPTGMIGAVNTFSVTHTSYDSIQVNISANKGGQVEITLDYSIGGTETSVEFVQSGSNTFTFDNINANGMTVPPGDSIDVSISYRTGNTHLPLTDVEHHQSGYSISLVRPTTTSTGASIAPPMTYWDDSNLTDPWNSLDGVTNSTGCSGSCHQWQNRGTNNSNPEVINTWWFINTEIRTARFRMPVLLAVETTDFSLTPERDKVLVRWTSTAEPEDLEAYEVHRSTDGVNFEYVASVKAKNRPSTYSVTDYTLPASGGKLYYLLKTVTGGETRNLSSAMVEYIHPGDDQELLVAMQDKFFSMKSNQEHEFDYQVVSLEGRVILAGRGITNERIPLESVSGYVLIRCRVNNQDFIQKALLH